MRPIDAIEKHCTFCATRGLRFSCDLQNSIQYYDHPCYMRHEHVCLKAEEVRKEMHLRVVGRSTPVRGKRE